MQSEQLLIADSVKFRVLTRTEKANYSTHTKKKDNRLLGQFITHAS